MKKVFFTCGPSQLYPTVEAHIKNGLKENIFSISHRGEVYMAFHEAAVVGLRNLMGIPSNYEIFFISSGTEGMERVIQNCVSKKSAHVVNGSFSKRWMTVSQQLGKATESAIFKEGEAVDAKKVKFSKDAELICITHNETSTGVLTSQSIISSLRKKYPKALLGVDIVSSAPTAELDFSTVDAVIFSVQKGFGLPAGLGVLVVSPRAMAKSLELTKRSLSGTYHSFSELKKYSDKKQTPDTPNVLGIYLLSKVVKDLEKIGIKKLRAQTKDRAKRLYDLCKGHKILTPFVKEKSAQSPTTIVLEVRSLPAGRQGSAPLISALKAQGIVVSSGYKDFKDRHIRIGNFPAHSKADFERLIKALSQKGQ